MAISKPTLPWSLPRQLAKTPARWRNGSPGSASFRKAGKRPPWPGQASSTFGWGRRPSVRRSMPCARIRISASFPSNGPKPSSSISAHPTSPRRCTWAIYAPPCWGTVSPAYFAGWDIRLPASTISVTGARNLENFCSLIAPPEGPRLSRIMPSISWRSFTKKGTRRRNPIPPKWPRPAPSWRPCRTATRND